MLFELLEKFMLDPISSVFRASLFYVCANGDHPSKTRHMHIRGTGTVFEFGMVIPARQRGVNMQKSPSRECGFRRTQVSQISKDDLME